MPRKAKAVDEQDALIARSIGSRIKEVRDELGLTPKEFGAACGVSQAQQYRIESGERVPDLIYLAKLKAKHGVSIERLLPEALPRQSNLKASRHATNITQNATGANAVVVANVKGGMKITQK